MPPSSIAKSRPITDESDPFIWTELKHSNYSISQKMNEKFYRIEKCSGNCVYLLDCSARKKYDTFEFLVVEKVVERP